MNTLLLIMAIAGYSCKKKVECPKAGLTFNYFKPGVNYAPEVDSFLLGGEITVDAAVPKSFYEEEKQYSVYFDKNTISGPFRIHKTSIDSLSLFEGAVDDVEIYPISGKIVKDTIQFTTAQLKTFRTVYWDGNDNDSLRLKLIIKPKIKGTFLLNLGLQGNEDSQCALFKYSVKVKNTNQHLYFVAAINNGYIGEYTQNFGYAFRVY